MKLVVFTPALKASAIGRMASLVVHSLLTHGHEVVVVRTEGEHLLDAETHEFGDATVPWTNSAKVLSVVKNADICIYQIGDNYEFHQGALEWLMNFPGVVCLHDFFVGHLFCGWAQHNRQLATNTLRAWYGDDIASKFFNLSNGESFIHSTKDHSPLTEWICSLASGVITHSSWGCDRVLNSCPGPVRVVPLAYNAPGESLPTANTKSSKSKFQILTIGHVNPNKRIESCIKAISGTPSLRENTIYRLVGAIRPEIEAELSALAEKSGVELVISGEVDDATLATAIKESDVVSCLRWPSLEAASASAIEAMLYGKATIVTNTGFYSEIPDSYAIKINPDNEVNELQAALVLLQKDPESAKTIGTRGQQWALSTFTAENYSQQLIDIAQATLQANVSVKAVNHLCAILEGWKATPELLHNEEIFRPLTVFQ